MAQDEPTGLKTSPLSPRAISAALALPPPPESRVLGASEVDHGANDIIAQYGKLPETSRVHKYVAQRLDILLKDFPIAEKPRLVVLGRKGVGVNAFATSGGSIIVSPELIRFVKHTEELDFVLLHEAAHLAEKHHSAMRDAAESGSGLGVAGRSRLSEYEADLKAFLALAHPERDSSPMGAILALERFNGLKEGAWDIAHGSAVDRIMNLKTYTLFRDLNTDGATPDEAGSMSKPLRTVPLMVRSDIDALKSGNLVDTLVDNPSLSLRDRAVRFAFLSFSKTD